MTTSGQQPATGGARFEELEAYRGIAALCIIIFHAYQYTREALKLPDYLYEGTPLHTLFGGLHLSGLFFTLSGFLLFLPFARSALSQERERSVRDYLIRRFIRILPLYYLTLLTVWAWRFQGRPDQVEDLLLHLTFTHVFHPTYIFWTVGPAWSLAVEVHFYLFLAAFGPLCYRLCGRLHTPAARKALLAAMIGAVIAASVAFKWWADGSYALLPTGKAIFYTLPAKFDALGLGMLLALLVAGRAGRPLFGAPVAVLLQAGGVGLIAAAMVLMQEYKVVRLYHATLVALGGTLLIGSTVLGPRGSLWERGLRLAPLKFLGTISYGLYMLHEPILIELGKIGFLISPQPDAFPSNALILIGLSIVAATLSYHLVEQPFNELRHLFDSRGRLVRRYAEELAGGGWRG